MELKKLLRKLVSDLNDEIEAFRNSLYIKDKRKHATGCLVLTPLLNFYSNEDGSLLYLDADQDVWIVKDSFIPDIDNEGLKQALFFLSLQS